MNYVQESLLLAVKATVNIFTAFHSFSIWAGFSLSMFPSWEQWVLNLNLTSSHAISKSKTIISAYFWSCLQEKWHSKYTCVHYTFIWNTWWIIENNNSHRPLRVRLQNNTIVSFSSLFEATVCVYVCVCHPTQLEITIIPLVKPLS